MQRIALRDLWRGGRHWALLVIYGFIAAALGAGGMLLFSGRGLNRPEPVSRVPEAEGPEEHGGVSDKHENGETGHVVLPKHQWAAAKIQIEPAQRGALTQFKWVTGKLTVNEDRTAHIYPLVDGQVHALNVRFGQDVKKGDVLAEIDSRSIGEAKLELVQNRLDAEIAKVNYEWDQKINDNTQALIAALAKRTKLAELEQLFRDQPMGEYRQQLLTAYANLHKSEADYERLGSLGEQGITAGKQLLYAKATLEADQATLQALLEQIKFTAARAALQSKQALEKAETERRVSEARLYILGYNETALEKIDPMREGEDIAHYPVVAPFDGTIIEKEVVFDERVGPDRRMFQLSDLSTLWVQADIYQQDLQWLKQVAKKVRFRSPADNHEHEAEVFYTGDVVDPETRTARLLGTVENPDRHLKPGMFVDVQLPGETVADVLRIPAAAIQEQEGKTFVFVHTDGTEFERRDVIVGGTSESMVEVRQGLKPGELVVVAGAFALKSEMMRGQLEEGGHQH